MKIQVNHVRLRISLIALLVCCVVAGCRTWQADRVAMIIGKPVPKAAFVWRSGQTIDVHPEPIKVHKKAEFVYWTCYERFEIEYKERDYPQPMCTQQPDIPGGLYSCSSQVFPMKDRFDYKITIFPSPGEPVSKDPEIEVLD